MLRRALPSTTTSSAFNCFAAAAPQFRSAVRNVSVHMSEPIGQGKVIHRKHDYVRPAYSVPSFPQWAVVITSWIGVNTLPYAIGCFTVIWGLHGGFTGHLPPDPHDIWK